MPQTILHCKYQEATYAILYYSQTINRNIVESPVEYTVSATEPTVTIRAYA